MGEFKEYLWSHGENLRLLSEQRDRTFYIDIYIATNGLREMPERGAGEGEIHARTECEHPGVGFPSDFREIPSILRRFSVDL